LIKQADGILIGAGVGINIDSGVPDFRSNNGFWKTYPSLEKEGIDFFEIANPKTLARVPRLAWGFYRQRQKLYRDTVPHAGFSILQELTAHTPHGAFVFTSNVDGQFQKSGFDESRIAEIHGSLHHMQCCGPCSESIWTAGEIDAEVDEEQCMLQSELPLCAHCDLLARPNVLMFDDWSWLPARTEVQLARLHAWRLEVSNPVLVEIGAGVEIPSVRRLGESLNIPLIRINPKHPDIEKRQGVGLSLGALEGLQQIQAAFKRL